ncbi:hypothetical protein OF83DRAFT_1155106 [Amylostereum chailletii]|nr:hypothetical protein OF83DRAFT_1155106 [Amylostereum chailletii]
MGTKPLEEPSTSMPQMPLAWFTPDAHRDRDAQAILDTHRLIPIQSSRVYESWVTCAASGELPSNPTHRRYRLTLHASGAGTCSCPDWHHRGGACKHLRAFKIVVLAWIKTGWLGYTHKFAQSREEAEAIYKSNITWYGPHLSVSVTYTIPSDLLEVPSKTMEVAPQLPPPHLASQSPSLQMEQDLYALALDGEQERCVSELIAQEGEEEADVPSDVITVDRPGDTDVGTPWDADLQRQVVYEQITGWIKHVVHQLQLPVHGLINLLDDCENLPSSEELLQFQELAQVTADRLVIILG